MAVMCDEMLAGLDNCNMFTSCSENSHDKQEL